MGVPIDGHDVGAQPRRLDRDLATELSAAPDHVPRSVPDD
jgi:hypothetical protein